jgi:hypothetical protein
MAEALGTVHTRGTVMVVSSPKVRFWSDGNSSPRNDVYPLVLLYIYIYIYIYIHILPQNICRWPLCKSANVGSASFVAVTISANWNWHPRSFSFKWGKKKKLHDVRSGEYGECGKMVTCCFARCAGMLWCSNSQFFLHQCYGTLRPNWIA